MKTTSNKTKWNFLRLLCLMGLVTGWNLNIDAQSPCQNAWASYSDSTYCKSQGLIAPDSVFPAGGRFVASPAGLVLDTLGNIHLLASQAGTYQLGYISPDSCRDTFHLSLNILADRIAAIVYPPAGCTDEPDLLPQIQGDSGGVFFSSPGLRLDSISGRVNVAASDTGNYTLFYGLGGVCGDTTSVSLVIEDRKDAGFHYPDSVRCGNKSPMDPVLTGDAGGRFSWRNHGSGMSGTPVLSVDSLTGKIIPRNSSAGLYWVTYRHAGFCPAADSFQVRILAGDNPYFQYAAQICTAGPNPVPDSVALPGGTFSGMVFTNGNTGEIDLSQNAAGSYAVQYATAGACPDSLTRVVTLASRTSATFYYPDSSYCQGAILAAPVITGAGGGRFFWNPPATSNQSQLVLDSLTGFINLQQSDPDTFAICYASPGFCSDTAEFTIRVAGQGNADFSFLPASFCISDANPLPVITGDSGGIFSVVYGPAIIDDSTGMLLLGQSQPSDSIILRYRVNGPSGGCPDSSEFLVRIFAPDTSISVAYDTTDYCPGLQDPLPQLTGPAGGTFQAEPPGISFISRFSGEIDLSQSDPGTYLVRYHPTGACTDTSNGFVLTIHPEDRLGFNYPQAQFCKDSLLVAPIGLRDSSGSFSEPTGGLIWADSVLGIFDLGNSNEGIYSIRYRSGGACPRDTSLNITLYDSPELLLISTADQNRICEGETVEFRTFGADLYEFSLNGIVRQPLFFTDAFTPQVPLHHGDSLTVRAVNNQGACADTAGLRMTVYSLPEINILNQPEGIGTGEPVELLMQFQGDSGLVKIQGDWEQGPDSVFPHLENGEFIFAEFLPDLPEVNHPRDLMLTITPQTAMCPGPTDTILFSLIPGDGQIFVPGVLTPNSDGFNDTWKITWKEGVDPQNYEITVFNGSAGQVYQQSGLEGEWAGGNLPDGVYWYVIKDETGSAIKRNGLTIRRN